MLLHGKLVRHFAKRVLNRLFIVGDFDFLFQLGDVELRFELAVEVVENRHVHARNKAPGARGAREQIIEFDGGNAGRSRKRNARVKRCTCGTDIRVCGTECAFGGKHVRAQHQDFRRNAGFKRLEQVRRRKRKRGNIIQFRKRGFAAKQSQCVFRLLPALAKLLRGSHRGMILGFGGGEIDFGDRALCEEILHDVVPSQSREERLFGKRKTFVGKTERVVLKRDFRNERQADSTFVFGGGKPLFERLIRHRAHAPPEIDLIRSGNPELECVRRISRAVGRQVFVRAGTRKRAASRNARKQFRPLNVVAGAKLFDGENGDAEVAVLFEPGLNQGFEPFVGKEFRPAEARHRAPVFGRRRNACVGFGDEIVHVGTHVIGRHRRARRRHGKKRKNGKIFKHSFYFLMKVESLMLKA